MRGKDAPNAPDELQSLRGEKAGCFCEVAGVSIVDAGSLCSR